MLGVRILDAKLWYFAVLLEVNRSGTAFPPAGWFHRQSFQVEH
jgi:hypothetical protein